MDFLDPSKQRAHQIRLLVGYVLIGVSILIISLILVLQSYGYGVDRKTGDIIQNGLLFVASQPEQADVYVNGKQYKSQSNQGIIPSSTTRLILPANTYTLQLKRDGYRVWQRTFELAGGTIERMVYPFLFPEKFDTKDSTISLYATAPAFATESPDRHWIVVQQPGKIDTFDTYDANDPKKTVAPFSLPTGLLSAGDPQSLKLVEWSTDNRHILVDHTFATSHEFIIIDRDTPSNSINVNRILGRNPSKVTLRDKRYDRLYLYDDAAHTLDFADLKDKSVKPVLTSVLAYKTHGEDMILYASEKDAPVGKTRIMLKDADGSYTVRDVTKDPVYLLDLARYDGNWYTVMGSAVENKAFVYKNPLDYIKTPDPTKPLYPAVTLRIDRPQKVSFSANTQYIAVQSSSRFAVYDIEYKRIYRYDTGLAVPDGEFAKWMDGNRLTLTQQNELVVFDFDGINKQTLVPNQLGIEPFFDRDYKVMYNIAPSKSTPGKFSLTKSNLKITNNQ